MSPDLKPVTFRLDRHLLEGLDEIKRRDGVSVTEQVRRAIQAWLEQKGAKAKTADRRGVKLRRKA